MKTPRLLAVLLFTSCGLLHAANWPQFRGPDGNAVSNDSKVPLKWSATENMKWKAPLPGAGSSCPIVWGDRVFVTCFSGQGDNGDVSKLIRSVVCFDKASGKQLWKKDFAAPQPEDAWQGMIREHGYASNTPVTDGKSLFVQLGKGGVVALDYTGKELWH
ncbi:MAG TPA: PQQ-binding-like beta-propeller repeat protein, partial [Verrucomicrobiaceae bacterium]